MEEYLIVDGYNMMGAWPELQDLKEENLEHARDRLAEILISHHAMTKRKIILVFDAYQVKQNIGSTEMRGGIEIIYTKENVTADMAIERLAAQIPKHKKVYVATSDRLQQETIWGKGAFRISAMELLREIKQTEKEHHRHIEQKVYVSNRLEDQLNPEVRAALEKLIHQDKK
ncbi:MAG: NYN domain-containing protein [Peptococcaceae bacterium]|nr:NYN domain-containing protein [Peptococcaceae bacterium]